jgi:hypothetical protein
MDDVHLALIAASIALALSVLLKWIFAPPGKRHRGAPRAPVRTAGERTSAESRRREVATSGPWEIGKL